jgi:hypothetical protein
LAPWEHWSGPNNNYQQQQLQADVGNKEQARMMPVPAQAISGQTPAPEPLVPTAGTVVPHVQQKWEADVQEFKKQASERVSIAIAPISSVR